MKYVEDGEAGWTSVVSRRRKKSARSEDMLIVRIRILS